MKYRTGLAVFVGAITYLVLELASYSDWLWPSMKVAGTVSGVATLLGLFVPALVAASTARRSPLIVGAALGVSVIVVRFALSIPLLGWDFAVADLRVSPAAPLLLFAFCIVFTYAGTVLVNRISAANRDVVT